MKGTLLSRKRQTNNIVPSTTTTSSKSLVVAVKPKSNQLLESASKAPSGNAVTKEILARSFEVAGSDMFLDYPGTIPGETSLMGNSQTTSSASSSSQPSSSSSSPPLSPPPPTTITTMANLSNLAPQLRSINLSFHSIQKIEGLEGCVELRELKLYNNQLEEVSGLENAKKIERLYLQRNQIQKFLPLPFSSSPSSALSNAKFLRTLRLDGNQLTSAALSEGGGILEKCFSLVELDLSDNKLDSTSFLTKAPLKQLTSLRLSHNKLAGDIGTDLLNISSLPLLTDLALDGNQYTGFQTSFFTQNTSVGATSSGSGSSSSGSSAASNVQFLDISDNALIGCLCVPFLPFLIELNVCRNKLTSIRGNSSVSTSAAATASSSSSSAPSKSVPTSFTDLTKSTPVLEVLDISDNCIGPAISQSLKSYIQILSERKKQEAEKKLLASTTISSSSSPVKRIAGAKRVTGGGGGRGGGTAKVVTTLSSTSIATAAKTQNEEEDDDDDDTAAATTQYLQPFLTSILQPLSNLTCLAEVHAGGNPCSGYASVSTVLAAALNRNSNNNTRTEQSSSPNSIISQSSKSSSVFMKDGKPPAFLADCIQKYIPLLDVLDGFIMPWAQLQQEEAGATASSSSSSTSSTTSSPTGKTGTAFAAANAAIGSLGGKNSFLPQRPGTGDRSKKAGGGLGGVGTGLREQQQLPSNGIKLAPGVTPNFMLTTRPGTASGSSSSSSSSGRPMTSGGNSGSSSGSNSGSNAASSATTTTTLNTNHLRTLLADTSYATLAASSAVPQATTLSMLEMLTSMNGTTGAKPLKQVFSAEEILAQTMQAKDVLAKAKHEMSARLQRAAKGVKDRASIVTVEGSSGGNIVLDGSSATTTTAKSSSATATTVNKYLNVGKSKMNLIGAGAESSVSGSNRSNREHKAADDDADNNYDDDDNGCRLSIDEADNSDNIINNYPSRKKYLNTTAKYTSKSRTNNNYFQHDDDDDDTRRNGSGGEIEDDLLAEALRKADAAVSNVAGVTKTSSSSLVSNAAPRSLRSALQFARNGSGGGDTNENEVATG